jgi:hypothetical protein
MEKGLYPKAVGRLVSTGRTSAQILPVAALDVVWLVLFVISWIRTQDRR